MDTKRIIDELIKNKHYKNISIEKIVTPLRTLVVAVYDDGKAAYVQNLSQWGKKYAYEELCMWITYTLGSRADK